MRRMMIKVGVAFLFVFAALSFGLWLLGMLYIRLPNSRVFIHETESATSSVYKAGNGDYLVFLDSETVKFPVYIILNEGASVGTPVAPIPSSYTKSVKTNLFVLCLQCSPVLAGTEKLDLRAGICTTPNEINFHVYEDVVRIRF